jgi:hypothetical protein
MRKGFSALALALFCAATPARAFYTRGYFERSAERGGAGRLYYTGAQRERGWDCTACHEHPAGRIRIAFETEPPDLIATRRYAPDTAYRIVVSLENEHRGFDAQFNSNGFVAEFSQGSSKIGTLSSSSGTELAENGRIVLSLNDTTGLDRWIFRWTAPSPGSGTVVVNLGAVDGDGAGRPDLSFQDHLHDDVFVGELVLHEGPGTALGALEPQRRYPSELPPAFGSSSPGGAARPDRSAGFGALVLVLGIRRIRRRERRGAPGPGGLEPAG